MDASTFKLSASDGTPLHVYVWRAPAAPRAIVQISHGMGEHAGRYAPLAGRLNAAGYTVYAHDQRGHGLSVPDEAQLGHMGDADGWSRTVADLGDVQRRIAQDHPELPLFLLGHSMGSFLAQQYLPDCAHQLRGAVLSGSSAGGGGALRLVRWLSRFERWRVGPAGHSALLQKLLFGRMNSAFDAPRTEFDWLSRDPAEVDKYVDDRFCGFVLSTQSLRDMLLAMRDLHAPERLSQLPPGLPLYIFSGSDDPVHGGDCSGLHRLMDVYIEAGLEAVTLRVYGGGRHEMLNETNAARVMDDLVDWFDAQLDGPRTPR